MDIRTRLDCETLAARLVPRDDQATCRFFEQAARTLLRETLWALVSTGARWDLRDVILVMRDKERLRALLQTTPEGQDVWASYFRNEELGENVMASVQMFLMRLSIEAARTLREGDRR